MAEKINDEGFPKVSAQAFMSKQAAHVEEVARMLTVNPLQTSDIAIYRADRDPQPLGQCLSRNRPSCRAKMVQKG
jgi:hypothetical protein